MTRLYISSGRKGRMAIAQGRGTNSRHAGIARRLLLTISVLCLGILASSAQGAFAAEITSAGPLTKIGISSDLNCSVNHSGDTAGEFYGGTACGTFVAVAGSHYGPASVPAGNSGNPPYTPISQSAVTGSGTSGDPYKIVTVVGLGTSGLELTETDSYVVGDESYRTDLQLHNTTGSSIEALLYRAGDCYLQNSDEGFGKVDTTTGAVSCVSAVEENGELVPGPRIEQWFPLSAGSAYYEAFFAEVWQATVSNATLPNTCRCTEHIDNGAGLSWNVTIPAGGSVTRSNLVTFSPLGHLPLSTTKAADSATASPGGSDGYTITISNPNTSAVSLTAITDTLPTGFTYTSGSTTGVTTSDPTVSAQTLTWNGPINVPAEAGGTPGTVALHFDVTVSSVAGNYFNNAGGEADEFTVAPTGDTAPVTVSGGTTEEPTTTLTSLSGGGKSGGSITVSEGTAVTDQATLEGKNAGSATGSVNYKVYSDNTCKTEVADAGTVTVSGGSVPASNPESLAQGSYYWQATYGGDGSLNEGSQSACESEVETVGPPPPTCTKVIGSARVTIRKEGETEKQKVANKLSTKLTDKQKLVVTWENGASKLTLTKLMSASCVVEARKKKFIGKGEVTVNGSPGWIGNFNFTTNNKQAFRFHIRLTKPKEEPLALIISAANLTSEAIS